MQNSELSGSRLGERSRARVLVIKASILARDQRLIWASLRGASRVPPTSASFLPRAADRSRTKGLRARQARSIERKGVAVRLASRGYRIGRSVARSRPRGPPMAGSRGEHHQSGFVALCLHLGSCRRAPGAHLVASCRTSELPCSRPDSPQTNSSRSRRAIPFELLRSSLD